MMDVYMLLAYPLVIYIGVSILVTMNLLSHLQYVINQLVISGLDHMITSCMLLIFM